MQMLTTKPTHILVAEDEAILRMMAVEVLTDAGHIVLDAPNGTEGLEMFKAHPEIVLLISDIRMPGLNGFELAEAAMGMKPDLKVLFMTGYSQEPMPGRLSSAGIEFLYKPFDLETLPDAVERLLEKD
jgi:DNA-binding NtrC family response regulator